VSQENVEIVRGLFEATNRRDFAAAIDAVAEEAVLVVHGLLPDGTFLGREAIGRWFGDWFSAFGPDYHFEVEEARALGDRVLIIARHHGSGRASGVAVEGTTAYAYTVKSGKIARVEMWATRAEALKAVGLEEWAGSTRAGLTPTTPRASSGLVRPVSTAA
jgi:ketosteroid isomerase-like protein